MLHKQFLLNKNFLPFLQQLCLLLQGNFPLATALQAIAEEDKRQWYKQSVHYLIEKLVDGKTLAQALLPFNAHLDAELFQLIHIGQKYNALLQLLVYYLDNNKQTLEFRKRLIKRLIYPIFTLIATIVVLIMLAELVIPQFQHVFNNSDADLSLLTKSIFAVANFLNDFKIALLVFIIMVFYAVILVRSNSYLRALFINWIANLPVLSKLITSKELFHLLNIMPLLLKNHINLMDIMATIKRVMLSDKGKMALDNIQINLISGKGIADSIGDSNLLSPAFMSMLDKGEKSGNLVATLEHLASIYKQKNSWLEDRFLLMLEPILTVILSLMAGFLVVGLYLPIFNVGLLAN